MIEITLSGSRFGTAPQPDGGKTLIFRDGSVAVTAPLTAAGVERLVRELNMSNEELTEMIEGSTPSPPTFQS